MTFAPSRLLVEKRLKNRVEGVERGGHDIRVILSGLTKLLDEGPLAGHAGLDALREINPEMQTFRSWLAGRGRKEFYDALGANEAWAYDHT